MHFGKVVFRNTMAGGTSWPWKINGPIYEPPSKRTVNKISAMSIHFPRTFNHPGTKRLSLEMAVEKIGSDRVF